MWLDNFYECLDIIKEMNVHTMDSVGCCHDHTCDSIGNLVSNISNADSFSLQRRNEKKYEVS